MVSKQRNSCGRARRTPGADPKLALQTSPPVGRQLGMSIAIEAREPIVGRPQINRSRIVDQFPLDVRQCH